MTKALGKLLMQAVMVAFLFVGPMLLFRMFGEDVRDGAALAYTDELLDAITGDGVLTMEEYLAYADSLARLEGGYAAEIAHTSYVTECHYEYADEGKIHGYFSERNVLSDGYVPVFPVEFPEPDTGGMALQEQTNASVFSLLAGGGCVPLPDDDAAGGVSYAAVLPVQECYEGEMLVTVVRVQDAGMAYYLEADSVMVTGSGTGRAMLEYGGVPIGAYVDVTVYPRTYFCGNGHEMPLTKEKIEQWKGSGDYGGCAHCAEAPELIVADVAEAVSQVGTAWEGLGVHLSVQYMDGHTEPLHMDDAELYSDYDSNYCGRQEITVSYRGAVSQCFAVTLEGRACSQCGDACGGRSMADYARFGFCDRCLSGAPFYFGETYTQKSVARHDEILDALAQEGRYILNRGDYVEVRVISLKDSSTVFVRGKAARTRGQ